MRGHFLGLVFLGWMGLMMDRGRADWRTRTWRNPTSTLGSHRRSFAYALRGIHRLPQPSSRHFDVMQSRGGVYAISFHVPGKHKSVRASGK
ncbi:hypothetical protein QR685DRAFT_206943 [Neurospora intermedia]|uniref:Secreted protein n=1 Tax=Neurospora intermedia TaxID=5142 RepID=A0ABR3DG29_NEUIN